MWKGLRKTVKDVCSRCDECQCTKHTKKKYRHLPPKEAEVIPWETLCIDLICPYQFKCKGKSTLTLWALTMIDPATGWFEIADISTKCADIVS